MASQADKPPSNDRERSLIAKALREAGELPAVRADATPAADSITGYHILREIHRGGQGTVYQAIQQSTHQTVAIKILKEGPFADSRDRARFDREVRVLGRLNHPNIVAIHDSGAAGGHFFYVMDYVEGVSLDLWAASSQRSIRQVFEMMVKVCEAINAAHLRGIIHRDLKPGNILVDPADAPRILDFGLAKLTQADLQEDSVTQVMTMEGQFVGSLPWASPEQAAGRPDLIDIRTDVYALGVILYQMLTGRFPYPVVGGLHEVLGNIMHQEPVKPRTLRRQIDDEVQTIVLKCLSKDRERRYQSAGELARDLGHYLAGEPIEAKRDSALYVLSKQLQRYRVAVGVAAMFCVLACTSAGVFLYQREAKRKVLEEALSLAASLTVALVDEKAVADPMRTYSPEQGNLERLDQMVEKPVLQDQHQAQGSFRTTLGLGFLKRGLYDRAEDHLEKALQARMQFLEEPHPDLAESYYNLARALFFTNKFQRARACYGDALRQWQSLLGPDKAEGNAAYIESLNGLAACQHAVGDFSQSEALFRRVLRLRRNLPHVDARYTAASMNNLARCLFDRGRFAEAEENFRAALRQIAARQGGQPDEAGVNEVYVSRGWRSVAQCRLALGDNRQARAYLDKALQMLRAASDPGGLDHPDLANIKYELACCHYEDGDLTTARLLCAEALDAQLAGLKQPHVRIASSKALLGAVLTDERSWVQAERNLGEALDMRQALLPPSHPDVARSRYELARMHLAQQATDRALSLSREALEVQQQKLDAAHPAVADTLGVVGASLLRSARAAQAEPVLRQAVALREQLLPAEHWRVAEARSLLGECLTALGRYAEAEPLVVGALRVLESQRGPKSLRAAQARARYEALYRVWNKPRPIGASDVTQPHGS